MFPNSLRSRHTTQLYLNRVLPTRRGSSNANIGECRLPNSASIVRAYSLIRNGLSITGHTIFYESTGLSKLTLFKFTNGAHVIMIENVNA